MSKSYNYNLIPTCPTKNNLHTIYLHKFIKKPPKGHQSIQKSHVEGPFLISDANQNGANELLNEHPQLQGLHLPPMQTAHKQAHHQLINSILKIK